MIAKKDIHRIRFEKKTNFALDFWPFSGVGSRGVPRPGNGLSFHPRNASASRICPDGDGRKRAVPAVARETTVPLSRLLHGLQ